MEVSDMSHYICIPKAFGVFGPGCQLDHDVFPPELNRLEYALQQLPEGQDLIATGSARDYVITDHLARGLVREALSGIALREVTITFDKVFHAIKPKLATPLQNDRWMKVFAGNGQADFSVTRQRLVISERAQAFLSAYNMNECRMVPIAEFDLDPAQAREQLRLETRDRLLKLEHLDYSSIV